MVRLVKRSLQRKECTGNQRGGGRASDGKRTESVSSFLSTAEELANRQHAQDSSGGGKKSSD